MFSFKSKEVELPDTLLVEIKESRLMIRNGVKLLLGFGLNPKVYTGHGQLRHLIKKRYPMMNNESVKAAAKLFEDKLSKGTIKPTRIAGEDNKQRAGWVNQW